MRAAQTMTVSLPASVAQELEEVRRAVSGTSGEGFVIETLCAAAPLHSLPFFYRTAAGAEVDLLLEVPGHGLWALEVKRGLSGQADRSFMAACQDLQPTRRFVVNAGRERFPVNATTDAIGVAELARTLAALA